MTDLLPALRPGAEASSGTGPLPFDIAALQEALVACHVLWRRTPGGGRWPFAGDGPWHLIRPEQGDYAGTTESVIEGRDGVLRPIRVPDTPRPRVPLDAGEVALRDRVTGWLQLLPDPFERHLVWSATAQLHREGADRVEWGALVHEIGYDRTARRLAQRYREASARIVCRLQGWPLRRAKALAA